MDEYIFALASARPIKHYERKIPLKYVKRHSHFKLLDYIALLLVTDGKGDAAAVAMERLPNAVIFYYSKNAPCSPKFGEYLQRLTNICASSEWDDFIKDFLTEVFNNCEHKLRTRLEKCQRAIERRKMEDTITSNDRIAAQKPQGASLLKHWRGKTFGKILENFLERLWSYEIQPHRGGSISASIRLCIEAFRIGSAPGLLRYPTLAARIKKLGDYYGAARHIRRLLNDNDPRLTDLRKSISMREIRPSQPRLVEVTRNVVEILNDRTGKFGYEETKADEFRKSLGQPADKNGKPQKITVSSHCELTLALHFYERGTRSRRFMEMGVSKECCWLCKQFLNSLSRQSKQVVIEVSRNQRVTDGGWGIRDKINDGWGKPDKIHAGWGMPDKTPSRVAQKMWRIIDHELCDIQKNVLVYRQSDSEYECDYDLIV